MRWNALIAVTMALACGRGDDSGGTPKGSESAATDDIPPEMSDRDQNLPLPPETTPRQTGNRQAETPADSEFKRPERRPVRTVPPLTRPDTTP